MALRWFALALAFFAAAAADPPKSWIDPATGHRVVRVSDEPGSSSLYFNFNAYTPDGKILVFSSPSGIMAAETGSWRLKKIVPGKAHLLFVGRKTGLVYYDTDAGQSSAAKKIFAVAPTGGAPRLVAQIPAGTIQTINSDETLLAGVEEFAPPGKVDREGLMPGSGPKPTKGEMMRTRLAAKIPMRIFTVDLKSGAIRTVLSGTDWFDHLQFSPADPHLLLFCHEGPWYRVDRLWLIRTDKPHAKPLKLHTRTMAMEIAGHEWFSADGKTVWYDLQTPMGEDFWVAGYDIATGARTRYHLQRNEWSVHFNSSPGGALFSGDGGGPSMVAHAKNGQWIYLFRPRFISAADAPAGNLIRPGVFEAEKLVNLKDHNYQLEPNANFTPDGKWLVFRSNMHGASQVYAVEIAKAKPVP